MGVEKVGTNQLIFMRFVWQWEMVSGIVWLDLESLYFAFLPFCEILRPHFAPGSKNVGFTPSCFALSFSK